ncbi:DinB family protein [Altibacter sp. HG106]|uniref:DinB family protein n=1 Tax=Altibacter sp. HG106 TaxID=3023937 RepID=UPI0023509A72|nr:DinB family protein [Altibacter sp. HG106]MDC7995650.1 DinB family protein [Altibacter sp. HG106]
MNIKTTVKQQITFLLFAVTLVCVTPLAAQDNVYIQEYLERLKQSKEYLLVVADLMPEEQYGFKVTPESMTFEEHLMHIAWAMDWHSQSLMGGRKARNWETDNTLKVHHKSKAEMMETLSNTFETTIAFISAFDSKHLDDRLDYFGANRTKRQILMLLSDHITHHRAQMLVSLRLKGITPPRYVLYQ